MTKKDYIAIAALIKSVEHNPSHYFVSGDSGYTQGVYSVAVALANEIFPRDNPRFDRARFLAACGVQS